MHHAIKAPYLHTAIVGVSDDEPIAILSEAQLIGRSEIAWQASLPSNTPDVRSFRQGEQGDGGCRRVGHSHQRPLNIARYAFVVLAAANVYTAHKLAEKRALSNIFSK